MKNYYMVPIGTFLSVLALMKLSSWLNTADTFMNILALIGIVTIFLIVIKTKFFTTLNLFKKNK